MRNLNKKGFTLVELLAVIVVLAIIMIIAIPNVLNSMDAAREKSFVIEARKILNKAQEVYQTEELTGADHGKNKNGCYTLEELGLGAAPGYVGSVKVTETEAKIWLSDKNYIVQDKKNDELDKDGSVTKVTDENGTASETCGVNS